MLYHHCLFNCFKNTLKVDTSKPGGIEIEWSIKLVVCADNGNVMVENMEEQDRQCTYKIETCSCNHSCNGRAISIIQVSQEERTELRESVPYVKVYRYNPKHLYPKLNGFRDNGK